MRKLINLSYGIMVFGTLNVLFPEMVMAPGAMIVVVVVAALLLAGVLTIIQGCSGHGDCAGAKSTIELLVLILSACMIMLTIDYKTIVVYGVVPVRTQWIGFGSLIVSLLIYRLYFEIPERQKYYSEELSKRTFLVFVLPLIAVATIAFTAQPHLPHPFLAGNEYAVRQAAVSFGELIAPLWAIGMIFGRITFYQIDREGN